LLIQDERLKILSLGDLVGSWFFGTVTFFLLGYLCLLLFLRLTTQKKTYQLSNLVLWGLWLIVFPPLIDRVIFGEQFFWSFYLFDGPREVLRSLVLFFGDDLRIGITLGTRVEVFLAAIFLGIYLARVKRKKTWMIWGSLGVYLVLFLLGVFPSVLTWIILGFQKGVFWSIQDHQVAKLFLSPLEVWGVNSWGIKTALHHKMALFYGPLIVLGLAWLQFLANREQFWALLKNLRFPQVIFNSGLFFLGMGLGWFYFPENFEINIFSVLAVINFWLAMVLAWSFSVVVNDSVDWKIDRISNQERPLVKKIFSSQEWLERGAIFFSLSLFLALIASKVLFLIILAYNLITLSYSDYPFRLKRVPLIAGIISSLASLLFFLAGYFLLSGENYLENFPWRIAGFLFVVYALIIPLKDIKDLKGDKKDQVFTVAGILGEQNARILFGALLFLAYIFSPWVLREPRLIPWSMAFGGLSYGLLNHQKISAKIFPWGVLTLVIIYGIILVGIIFRN
jgi:4-hydroxybenzoate polyprenyltransferase